MGKRYEQCSREELLEKISELETQIHNLKAEKSQPTDNSESEIDSFKKKYGSKILDSLTDMVSVVDYQGVHIGMISSEKTIHVGDSICGSLQGKNIQEFLPPDAYRSVRANLDNVIRTQEFSLGHHSLENNGKCRYFENRMIPLDNNYILAACREVTDYVNTRNRLELIGSAIDNSSDEIYATTIEGDIIFANGQFLNHYAKTEEIYGQKIYTVQPERNQRSWEDHILILRQGNGSRKFTTTHTHADGKVVPMEVVTNIILDSNGNEIVWAFSRDISELIRHQKKIDELNSLLNTILNNIPAYLFVKDTGDSFRYLYWNKAFELFSQIPASKAIGHTDEEIFPSSEDASKFRQDDQRLLDKGERIEFQESYLTAGGEIRTVNTIKSIIPLKGKAPLLIGISWDITDMKKTEQELIQARLKAEQSDKLKSAFLANMSHEIRTPLNAIVGFSKIIGESDDSEERQQYSTIIDRNAELLLQLINDILDLSKIEAGTLEFILRPVKIRELCENILDIHRQRILPPVNFILDQQDDIELSTDSNRLTQVLSNLITNAQKFTHSGEIRFGYQQRTDGMVEFYVKDTGIGISHGNATKIFSRFIKLNSFSQGTGLGLSICQMIVENLGGEIWVESEENVGSIFRFTIPNQRKTETPH